MEIHLAPLVVLEAGTGTGQASFLGRVREPW